MPGESGLVGQHVHVVVEHLQARFGIFHHDAALRVGDDPVQLRHAQLLDGRLAHDGHVCQVCFDFVDGFILAGDPKGEFVGGDVGPAFHGLGLVSGESGEVQPRNGQALVIRAVEVQGDALGGDAHTDQGEPGLGHGPERRGQLVVGGRDDDPFAIGKAPVQVAAEEHVPCLIGESDS